MNPYERYKGFTEGEYFVKHNVHDMPFISSYKYNHLALVSTSFPRAGNKEYNKDEAESNAKLFAAAPLLLQDCREMIEYIQKVINVTQRFSELVSPNQKGIQRQGIELLNRIEERHK